VQIEGVTLRDSGCFTLVPALCEGVRITGIKIIGNWRYNSDGINLINSSKCVVEDSFVRTFDDCICDNGLLKFGTHMYRLMLSEMGPEGSFDLDGLDTTNTFRDAQELYGTYDCEGASITDIRVTNCALWNDSGRALEIGAETVADEISNVSFESCDVIHVTHVAMEVQNNDRAMCRNISFTDIRVELDDDFTPPAFQESREMAYPAVSDGAGAEVMGLQIIDGYASSDFERGTIRAVTFRDIRVTATNLPRSSFAGFDADHDVDGVSLSNFELNGTSASSLTESGVRTNPHVRNVHYEAIRS
jgi:hypothetical protein